MTSSLDLSVCIVNWNAAEFLLACLESIERSRPSLRFETVVVDNASQDQSVPRVRQLFPHVRLIESKKNLGFAAAGNIALSRTSGRYRLLLNPDTLVRTGAFEAMVDFLDSDERAGACGCRLFHPETNRVEGSARPFPTLFSLFSYLSYLDKLFPMSPVFNAFRATHRPDRKTREVDWVSGACLMVRQNVLPAAGGLDESFFMFWEDVEWCYRIKKAGWTVHYVPAAEIAHYRGRSSRLRNASASSDLSVWGTQQYAAGLVYFFRKHRGAARTIGVRLIVLITSFWKAFLWAVAGFFSRKTSKEWGRVRSYLSMVPFALRKTTGPS